MSWMRYMTIKSFRYYNPDWEIRLYTSNCKVKQKTWVDAVNQDFFSYTGQDYFGRIGTLDVIVEPWNLLDEQYPDMSASHKSNFFKWHTLSNVGGIYADMDILWTKPIDSFYNGIKDLDTAICYTKYLSIGLLASKIGNSFYDDVYSSAHNNYRPDRYQCAGVENVYRLLYGHIPNSFLANGSPNWAWVLSNDILGDIRAKYPQLSFYNIPMNIVYPYMHKLMGSYFEDNIIDDLTPETVGLHWYAGSVMAQKYNSILKEFNFRAYDSTFCNVSKEILNDS